MNFLMLRSNNQTANQEQQSVNETKVEPNYASKRGSTLEGLIADEKLPQRTSSESHISETNDYGDDNDGSAGSSGKSDSQLDGHTDVSENEEFPDNWTEAPDILSYRSLDRSFVFPGEQIRILACLPACKQDTEVITPFKVAAVMNKNGLRPNPRKQNDKVGEEPNPVSQAVDAITQQNNQNGDIMMKGNIDSQKYVSTGESLLRMENHRRQTEQLLQRFNSSHFFARIAESNEPLWSKTRAQEAHPTQKLKEDSSAAAKTLRNKNPISAVIDRGTFDARTSGGVARGAVKCCSLPSGDIVVLLQVNVGVEFMRDPILEILQFEKHHKRNPTLENEHTLTSFNDDPSSELLKWLLPLEKSLPPRTKSPPILSSTTSIRSTSARTTVSGSSGSQLFSFGHFRSYSMSSLPPNMSPPQTIPKPTAKPSFDPEDWSQFSFRKFVESGKSGNEVLLSFRGVPLEPERFSVRCGLEGIFYTWKKNVSPENARDIVVFIDSITIIFEEASKGGPPLSLPIACTEAGNEYSLPDLELRRGEEHSFILKPAKTLLKHPKGQTYGNLRLPHLSPASAGSGWHPPSTEGKYSGTSSDQFSILVSCRCNYTESKLFFKQPTNWRPRNSKDLMISVASETSRQTLGSDGTQLPIQILTLQASNMTFEDLTLTVLAPASFTSPCVLSLSNSPSSPLSPFAASGEPAEKVNSDAKKAVVHGVSSVSLNQGQNVVDGDAPQSVSIKEHPMPISDAVPKSDLGCTHLWLQSRVPLGCVPSQSTTTIKLEVLPLTDGIITLDSLRIDVKEKGENVLMILDHFVWSVDQACLTYIPEHELKIHATASIATARK
ncbi:UNVERIFIED_CONTAM: hypothetical protein Sradi_6744900 [Sesamum radiatum]|uniref:Uncharacterized protein n=1 Tax=Sesamum radiatum TaxID=300843 RepID=A0AAW2JS60_SESRA